jgi:intraflagellar transport protein 81
MADLYGLSRAIVPLLNQGPFNKSLTLVGFDQLGPQQLLGVAAEVFREVSPEYAAIDVRADTAEAVARRMVDALAVLGYKLPDDQFALLDAIQAGARDAVYPVLAWLLAGLSKHRVKAYLARFLVPLPVPEEITAEEVYGQYRGAMDEFREVHKQLTAMRDAAATIYALKKDNAKLVQERTALVDKLDRAKRKVAEVPTGAALLAAAAEVRAQMDERHRVAEQLAAQKEKLAQAKEERARVQETLREVRGSASVGAEGFVKQLQEELGTNRFLLADDLPREIAAMREWKGLLEEVLGEPTITEASRAMLHQELTQLRSTVKDLNAKRAARQQPSDEQLGMYRQQAAVVERKRDEIAAQLKVVQEQLDDVKREHAEKQKQYEAAGGDARVLAGGQLEAFIEQVKSKAEEMKRVKTELSDMKAECGVLSRTRDILVAKDPSCPAVVAEFEAKGPAEPKPAEEKLEEMSQKKQELEEAKGKTLQELTKVLADLNIVL